METLAQDIKFSAKLLWKDRGFAITAILTLALCIGANTAIFSVINSVLLRSLPFEESERIMTMQNLYPGAGVTSEGGAGAPDYFDRIERTDAFEEIANYQSAGLALGDQQTPEQIAAWEATPSFFRLLRAQPHIGRIFTEDEGLVGSEQKALLSFAAWQQYYGGEESAVGRDIRLSGVLYEIVGVMPEDFYFQDRDVRVWIPIAFTDEEKQQIHSNQWQQIGRLRAGASPELAQQQIDAVNAANLERFPGFKEALINAGFHTTVIPLQDALVRDVRPTLYLLWGGVLFVLLIGCVNIANLVMVRSNVRVKELATRFALGAGRLRVIRQLLTESVVLTGIGGGLGLLFGYWGLSLLGSLGIDRLPRASEIGMDATVVVVTLAMALGVGVLIGLIPILSVVGVNMSSVFREEGRTGTSSKAARMARGSMVTAQVAIALILLIGAGLMLASFREVLSVDPGYNPANVLTGRVSLPLARYEGADERRAFVSRALEQIRTVPGVVEAGGTSNLPLGGNYNDSVIMAEGYAMSPGESLITPGQARVTPGYFEAMEIPLLRGRLFDATDTVDGLSSVIVDRRLAGKFWSGEDPIGKRMYFPTSPEDITAITDDTEFFSVVGVVESTSFRDVVVGGLDILGTYYFPYDQGTTRGVTFTVRTAADPSSVANAIRSEFARLDAELPFYGVLSMQERVDQALGPRRTPVVLALVFAVVALLLSAIGIYGVLSYLVTTRTKEIGIRLALGSGADQVFRLVLREGLVILGAGIGLGLLGAFALRATVESQLYGIEPLDPVVWVSVVVALAITAFFACVIPARRATRVDPVVALSQE